MIQLRDNRIRGGKLVYRIECDNDECGRYIREPLEFPEAAQTAQQAVDVLVDELRLDGWFFAKSGYTYCPVRRCEARPHG